MSQDPVQPLPPRRWAPRPLAEDVRRQALAEGFTPLQAMIIARRFQSIPPDGRIRSTITPSAQDLPRARDLPDMEVAATAVSQAIIRGDTLAIASDFDCDGVFASSILLTAMTTMFGVAREKVHAVHSHRLKEGYGVSSKLAERILALNPLPALCVSCDQGSCDEPRIAELVARGVPSFVVTDHHHLPHEGPPKSALACVNPAREDSRFGDPSIAGCMVAWYLVVAVRQKLIDAGHIRAADADVMQLLDFAAVGTIADCVDIGRSRANRWAVQKGLNLIRNGARPIWRAFAPHVRNQWTATAVAFNLAPKVNAGGRLGDAMRSLDAVMSADDGTANAWVDLLDQVNSKRRQIQSGLVDRALAMAGPMVQRGAAALCIPFFEDGNPGVHGVVASRVVEATGLPTVCLSEAGEAAEEPGMMAGSFRSVEGVHVKHILDRIMAAHPELRMRAGGHALAAGARLPAGNVPAFAEAWEREVAAITHRRPPAPLEHDGEMPCPPSADAATEIAALAPYGRGFPEPLFEATVDVTRIRPLGKDGKHAQIDARFQDGRVERMVWFGCTGPGGQLPDANGQQRIVYEFKASSFANGPVYDLQVKSATAAPY